ncbi:MAG: outer membrane beta-barrel protein [Saprospiraceae bacterium]|nr:outer membrane beta-barrel protein [Saprospiraceae bacterium]MCF8250464.1 outer membrane beta-barrel protein [Saprospiraceae bacterium]MCF8282758.1 outer membrane beta-barrel protein [Bacteroidales bacterium]MCF8312390.1 outer membrane beta-barrel protein [Saprospiraceae bacterium]MCF8440613.1 outer membrane beta-barrel protein [Saprospiraceae bacterium]
MKKSLFLSLQSICKPIFFFLLVLCASQLTAQNWPGAPGGGGGMGSGQQMNIGHLYGKIVDENNKGVGYATVQLYKMQFDTLSKSMNEVMLTGQITEDNGDFSLEKLPVMGDFNLKISFIGYAELTQKVSFGFKPGGGMPAGGFDKDLGNIKLVNSAQTLAEVTVTAEAAQATLALDKKVYRVDKDASAAGGNAQDALKNVPSLSVDLDGNVALRNGSPQIFVDGRPTTLSLDQISADAIESVEVITNPSAKYDAGGGTAGIINIILKKEKRLGYNGNVRVGTDTRKGYNLGGDVNARADKTNMFVSGSLNRMKRFSNGETYRDNLSGEPLTSVTQIADGTMNGYYANGRAGFDWFMDNRNTLTLSGSYTRGHFEPKDELTATTDSLYAVPTFSEYVRNTQQDRNFRNLGTSVQFKHLFPKVGAEWTADVNYNRVRFKGNSDYLTVYDTGNQFVELQSGDGKGQFMTFQTDVVNPLNDKMKLEGGVRAALRRNKNDNYNAHLDELGIEVQDSSQADHYKFSDDVYAAYGQFSHQFETWGYQVGLRAESSLYQGSLTDQDSSFSIGFPFSLFPSMFLTKKLNDLDNIQIAYTRRINRPNFFQTMPFTDYSNKETLRRGNPELEPEFANSVEVSYQNIFKNGHNLLLSVYYKRNSNLITSQFESGENLEGNIVPLITYGNSKSSQAYGAEATLKNTFFKIIDLTTNVNVYQSQVDATNFAEGVKIDQLSWFLKENLQIKLPAGLSIQLTGEYRSKASFTPDSGNRMPWQPGPTNTAQGYTLSNWFVDAAIRKDILKKKGSLTVNVSDIFKTRRNGTYTESGLFILQDYRYRDPQVFRINFSYRFGKMDTSLFKRKNMRMNMQGNDMMG